MILSEHINRSKEQWTYRYTRNYLTKLFETYNEIYRQLLSGCE